MTSQKPPGQLHPGKEPGPAHADPAIVTWDEFFDHQLAVYRSGRLDEVDPLLREAAQQRTAADYKQFAYQHTPTRFFLRSFSLLKGEYIFLSTPAAFVEKGLYILTNYRFIFQEKSGETVVLPLRTIRSVTGQRGVFGVKLAFQFHDGTERVFRIGIAPGARAFETLIEDHDWKRLPDRTEAYFGLRTAAHPIPAHALEARQAGVPNKTGAAVEEDDRKAGTLQRDEVDG